MSFARHTRRVTIAALSTSALLALAACGGGGGEPAPQASDPATDPAYEARGPITYVAGKDTSGYLATELELWNSQHPDEKVTFIELPDSADQQRAQMIQNAQTQGSEYTVLNVDVVWTSEFAANGWIDALPEDAFDLTGFLEPTVESGTYFDKLYAMPIYSDGGMLYYRTDWLEEAGVEPPTTFDEMKQACETIKAEVDEAADADCYAGQHQKYEGLTVNISEAVDSAGGHLTDDAGAPTANTPEAVAGMQWMADAFADGTIPEEAITWQEEQGRQAFQDGSLIFHRNWPYVYTLANADDGSSEVAGKFAVAPLPGVNGPGISSLGGHNFAINAFGKNKATAVDFINFMASEEEMKQRTIETSNAPARESLYSDPELTGEYPYLEVLKASIETARPRPKVVNYGDVTLAIQDAAYGTIQGQTEPAAAMDTLQTKLQELIQQ